MHSLDTTRAAFLTAFRAFLADRSISERDKEHEVGATIAAVSQLVVLAEVRGHA